MGVLPVCSDFQLDCMLARRLRVGGSVPVLGRLAYRLAFLVLSLLFPCFLTGPLHFIVLAY